MEINPYGTETERIVEMMLQQLQAALKVQVELNQQLVVDVGKLEERLAVLEAATPGSRE